MEFEEHEYDFTEKEEGSTDLVDAKQAVLTTKALWDIMGSSNIIKMSSNASHANLLIPGGEDKKTHDLYADDILWNYKSELENSNNCAGPDYPYTRTLINGVDYAKYKTNRMFEDDIAILGTVYTETQNYAGKMRTGPHMQYDSEDVGTVPKTIAAQIGGAALLRNLSYTKIPPGSRVYLGAPTWDVAKNKYPDSIWLERNKQCENLKQMTLIPKRLNPGIEKEELVDVCKDMKSKLEKPNQFFWPPRQLNEIQNSEVFDRKDMTAKGLLASHLTSGIAMVYYLLQQGILKINNEAMDPHHGLTFPTNNGNNIHADIRNFMNILTTTFGCFTLNASADVGPHFKKKQVQEFIDLFFETITDPNSSSVNHISAQFTDDNIMKKQKFLSIAPELGFTSTMNHFRKLNDKNIFYIPYGINPGKRGSCLFMNK